ncbi:MAG: ABC transporter permease [Chloroflexi bacterium]|nr:ABC transporter permease [Chloroflexota bacterium]
MAAQTQTIAAPRVATIARRPASLWADAWRRLLKNRAAMLGLVIITLTLLVAIFADDVIVATVEGREPRQILAPMPYATQDLEKHDAIPPWLPRIFPTVKPIGTEGGYARVSNKYILGADYNGRDLLSRIIYGTRVSLAVAIVGPLVSLLVGVSVGVVAGYSGGRTDNLIMRFVDIMYAFPDLLFIILLMALFRSTTGAAEAGTLRAFMTGIDNAMGGVFFIFVGIGVTAWMSMSRLTRGQILSLKEKEFVEAAHAVGAKDGRIITKHILPNILGPIVVAQTLNIPQYISTEAFLSFIGLGVQRPTPSWGSMIADGAAAIRTYPHQAIFPALALATIMFAFNFLGDGLRDALDPRLKGTD